MATKGSQASDLEIRVCMATKGFQSTDKYSGLAEFVSIQLTNGRRFFFASIRVQPCYGLRRKVFKKS